MSEDFVPLQKNNTMKTVAKYSYELNDNHFDDILSNGQVSEEEDDHQSIIESVVKYAV